MVEKSRNWGGKRAGAGKKPANKDRKPRFANSDDLLQALRDAEAASVADGNNSIAEQVIEMAKGGDQRVAAQMCKLYLDKVIVPASEHEVTKTTHRAPTVFLPEELPDEGIPAEATTH